MSASSGSAPPVDVTCRDRTGHWDLESFRLVTCSTCYGYLFPSGKQLRPYQRWLISSNDSTFPHMTIFLPDVHNASSRNDVCKTLNFDECVRWEECCSAAEQCCKAQLGARHHAAREMARDEAPYCPQTWDGYACWGDTPASSTLSTSCPGFIDYAVPTGQTYGDLLHSLYLVSCPMSLSLISILY